MFAVFHRSEQNRSMPPPRRCSVYQVQVFGFAHSLEIPVTLCIACWLGETCFYHLILDSLNLGRDDIADCRDLTAFNLEQVVYVCRTHPVYTGPDEQKVLTLMQDALLESGVDKRQITITTDPTFAVETMLQMGKKGDLLVFAPGAGQRLDTWNQITSFESA